MLNVPRIDRLSRIHSPDRGGLDVAYDREVLVETAEIQRVDTVLWTVDMHSRVTGRSLRNVEIPGVSVSRKGDMMGSMPQRGDKCLIVHPSDDPIPKILTFLPHVDPNTFARGRRKQMRPGEHIMSSSAGNYVHVHAGGLVDIAADPITRRLYVPILHQIKDFCENYFLNTAGGSMRWDNRRDQKGGDGTPTELVYDVKEFNQGGTVLTMRYGNVASITDMDDRAVSHQAINKDGTEVFRMTIDLSGNILVQSESADYQYVGDYSIDAGGDLTLTSAGVAILAGDAGVELAGAIEPAVLGDSLKAALDGFLTQFSAAMDQILPSLPTLFGPPAAPGPGQVTAGAAFGQLKGAAETLKAQLVTILAQDTKLS